MTVPIYFCTQGLRDEIAALTREQATMRDAAEAERALLEAKLADSMRAQQDPESAAMLVPVSACVALDESTASGFMLLFASSHMLGDCRCRHLHELHCITVPIYFCTQGLRDEIAALTREQATMRDAAEAERALLEAKLADSMRAQQDPESAAMLVPVSACVALDESTASGFMLLFASSHMLGDCRCRHLHELHCMTVPIYFCTQGLRDEIAALTREQATMRDAAEAERALLEAKLADSMRAQQDPESAAMLVPVSACVALDESTASGFMLLFASSHMLGDCRCRHLHELHCMTVPIYFCTQGLRDEIAALTREQATMRDAAEAERALLEAKLADSMRAQQDPESAAMLVPVSACVALDESTASGFMLLFASSHMLGDCRCRHLHELHCMTVPIYFCTQGLRDEIAALTREQATMRDAAEAERALLEAKLADSMRAQQDPESAAMLVPVSACVALDESTASGFMLLFASSHMLGDCRCRHLHELHSMTVPIYFCTQGLRDEIAALTREQATMRDAAEAERALLEAKLADSMRAQQDPESAAMLVPVSACVALDESTASGFMLLFASSHMLGDCRCRHLHELH